MTLSEDVNFGELDREEASSGYFVIFGRKITPRMGGIAIGIIGLLGAAYMVPNLVLPAWDNYQQQQVKQTDLQGQIDQAKASIKQIDKVKEELELSKKQETQVLGLFANENTLDTLLLDLNRLVESSNAKVQKNGVRAELKKFDPISNKAEPITDGSLGTQVNGKLKGRKINIEIVGTYEQTQSILRNIERLQPLLIIKDYQSTLAPETLSPSGKQVIRVGPEAITSSFQLEALMPLSPEELAAVAKTPPKK